MSCLMSRLRLSSRINGDGWMGACLCLRSNQMGTYRMSRGAMHGAIAFVSLFRLVHSSCFTVSVCLCDTSITIVRSGVYCSNLVAMYGGEERK
jgi:hypothetical protein